MRGKAEVQCAARLGRAFRQFRGKVDAFGQEILDQQALGGQCGAIGLGPQFQLPGAAGRIAGNGPGQRRTAGTGGGGRQPRRLDAIGAQDDGGQRQVFQRAGLGCAGKQRGVHRFADAIGAAIGGQKHVDRRGRGLALDAAIGQVELGIGQRQEGRVARRAFGALALPVGHRDHGRRRAVLAKRKPRREMCHALRIGRGAGQHLVRAADQRHIGPRLGRGVAQAAHHHRQPVAARIGRDAEIRDDEPLRRKPLLGGGVAVYAGLDDIDAGVQRAGLGRDGKAGGQFLVLAVAAHGLGDGGRALPDFTRHAVAEVARAPAVQGRREHILGHGADQVAVRDLQQRQVHPVGVDRDHRQPLVARGGQHIGPARETHRGRAVAHIARQRHVAGQCLAISCRQAGAQGDLHVLAMAEACDTDAVALGLDGQIALRQAQEGGVVTALCQIARQHGAESRQAAVGLDLGVGDAHAVAGLRFLQRRGDLGIAGCELRGQPQGRQRVIAPVQPLIGHREPGQRLGGHRVMTGAQIAVRRHRGGGLGAVAAVGVAGVKRQPCQIGPVFGAVLLGHGLRHQLCCLLHIALRFGHAGFGQGIGDGRRVHRGKAARLRGGRAQIVGRQEGCGGRAAFGEGQRGGVGRDHLPRKRAHEACGGAGSLALGETGAGVLVVGQRLTTGLGQAGLDAGLQRGVKHLADVAARHVAVGEQMHAPLGQGRIGGCQGRRQRQRRAQQCRHDPGQKCGHRATPLHPFGATLPAERAAGNDAIPIPVANRPSRHCARWCRRNRPSPRNRAASSR